MEVKKILVIRFRRVGDALLSTALCASLKASFPGAEVHYVVNEGIAPLFRDDPNIDRIITFNRQENGSLGAYVRKVRRVMGGCRYDLIVDIRSTFKTSLFCLMSMRTPLRVGFRKGYNRFQLTDRINRNDDCDIIDQTLELLDPLEARGLPVTRLRDMRVYITEDEKEDFRDYMISKGIDPERPVIVCGVACREEMKAWRMDYMEQVLCRVAAGFDVQLVLNYGDPAEKEQAIVLGSKLREGGAENVFIDIEAGSLRQLAAMLSLADLYFGNEGGARHIAQAVGTPSYSIFSPKAVKGQWLIDPSEDNRGIEWRDVPGAEELTDYRERFDSITPDRVWDEVSVMLERLFPESKK